MQAIKPFAEILDVGTNMDVLKKIEYVGRTCYKSNDQITDESAPKFVEGLIKRGHEAMLEHASFCFMLPFEEWRGLRRIIQNLELHDGFKCFLRFTNDSRPMVSGNVRAWRDFLKALYVDMNCLPSYMENFIVSNPVLFPEFQDANYYGINRKVQFKQIGTDILVTDNEFLTHCDISVLFIVDRGISHEIVRHRPASFAQESTRYCNYGKDKFGGQITFIIPEDFSYGSPAWKVWKESMERCEADYFALINMDSVTPQLARGVLGNSLKTEIIMTSNGYEWRHFFNLRALNKTGKAHPQMLEVCRPLLDDFKNTINFVFDDLKYE
jgi:thymidylate synthase (FAD)